MLLTKKQDFHPSISYSSFAKFIIEFYFEVKIKELNYDSNLSESNLSPNENLHYLAYIKV